MKRFVNRFGADGSSAAVIEYGLIIVLVGLACITAWMHVSASLKIPSASASTTASVETTGSVAQPRTAPCITHAETAPF